ncbi:GntR family transcriptional regulator [Mesobacillus zeae]|uniref:GntR family transcriptional regulator n=1 Tax=Mesobacillus zeae TaxID=1917180 RepID=A0A398B9U2_9BACI|nr:GntR family transcriptional regulator [Mesobacillus zeae]RID86304.1 GntR family transcriptional regulator [Mesobacillus zeae]
MIDKSSPLPIYYQLEELIKKQIETGELEPGDALPSEREYSETYQISRMTVRQAVNQLVQNGMLYRQQGKGTFVAERKIEKQLLGLTSFTEDMQGRGVQTSSDVVEFNIVLANAYIAGQMQLKKKDPVYEIKRIRLAENTPMAYEITYLPATLLNGLTKEAAAQSIYRYIEQHLNSPIGQAKQTIEASAADDVEAEYLQIAKGSPILLIERNTRLKDGTPVELAKSVYRADRYKFKVDISR